MWPGHLAEHSGVGSCHKRAPLYSVPPLQIQCSIKPHAIIILPNTDGMELLVCYGDEGVYVNTYGRITKDVVLQWGEMPTSVGTKGKPSPGLRVSIPPAARAVLTLGHPLGQSAKTDHRLTEITPSLL